jgi:hypothetical protein
MIKFNVDSYKDLDLYDLFVNEGNKILEFVQGLENNHLNAAIEHYLNQYKLTEQTMITHNVYDENDYLLTSITQPLHEFYDGSEY